MHLGCKSKKRGEKGGAISGKDPFLGRKKLCEGERHFFSTPKKIGSFKTGARKRGCHFWEGVILGSKNIVRRRKTLLFDPKEKTFLFDPRSKPGLPKHVCAWPHVFFATKMPSAFLSPPPFPKFGKNHGEMIKNCEEIAYGR